MEHRGFPEGETLLYDTIMVDTWYCAFVKTLRTMQHSVNFSVNYGLQLIIFQYCNITCNKYNMLIQDINWGSYVCRGGGIQEPHVLLPRYSVNLKQC